MTDQHPAPTRASRRRLLRTAAVAGGLPLAAGTAHAQTRINRRMVLPSVEEFEGSYQGQFVFIDEPTDADPGNVPITECDFDEVWPIDETQAYDAQLLDRRQEVPLAVDLVAYTNGQKTQIEPATHFVIQRVEDCPGDWVGMEAGSVPRRALAGKPPGPTVTPTDGPGFGALAALLGAAGAAALRAFGDE